MKTTLTTEETFKALRISEKTLRRWVKAGKIHPVVGTGGQGRRAIFAGSDVKKWRALNDKTRAIEVLARIAYAFEKHLIQPGFFRYWQFLYGRQERNPNLQHWIETPAGKMRLDRADSGKSYPDPETAALLLNALPPIEDVPSETKRLAERLGKNLSAEEIDFIGAVFFLIEYPRKEYSRDEIEARPKAIKMIKEEHGILMSDFYPNIDITGNNASSSKAVKFYIALQRKDASAIKNYASEEGEFSEVMPINKTLCSRVRKEYKEFLQEGKGIPSGAKIAAALGIRHRYQATRLWRGIANKLGSRQWELFAVFGWKTKYDLPRLFKRYATEPVRKRSAKDEQRAKPIDTEDAKAAVAEYIRMFNLKPNEVPTSRAGWRRLLKEKLRARREADRMALAGTGKSQIPVSREDETEMYGSAGDSE